MMPVTIEQHLADPYQKMLGRIIRVLNSQQMTDFLIYSERSGFGDFDLWRTEDPSTPESYAYTCGDHLWKNWLQPTTQYWLELIDGIDEMKRTRDYKILKRERQRMWDERLNTDPLPVYGPGTGVYAGQPVRWKYNHECVGPIYILLPRRDLTGWMPPCPNGWGRKVHKPGDSPTLYEKITAAIEATKGW
jgi:hypothetical protein